MELEAKIAFDRDYFRELFSQSTQYSKRTYYIGQKVFGILGVLGGSLWLALADRPKATAVALAFIGMHLLFSPLVNRYFWLKTQLDSKVAGKEISLIFSDEGIYTDGPFSSGLMSWNGVERILETPKGVLIWPQKGMHIYLSKSTVKPEVISFVIRKNL